MLLHSRIFPIFFMLKYAGRVSATLLQDFIRSEETRKSQSACLARMIENNFANNGGQEYLMYSLGNVSLGMDFVQIGRNFQMQVSNPNLSSDISVSSYNRYTGYIIATTGDDFPNVMRTLRVMQRWNARAKFILVADALDETLLQILVRYYVTNVILLRLPDLQLFTYQPYAFENLKKPHLELQSLGKCVSSNSQRHFLFANRIPKQWRNTTVTIAYMQLEPYIFENDANKLEGIEVDLVNLMKWYLQYDVEFLSQYQDWGEFNESTLLYSGPLGAVQAQTADFVLGHFHLREAERLRDFDTTFSYMDDDLCWSTPYASLRPHWENVIHIFHTNVYILTIILLASFCIVWRYSVVKSACVEPTKRRINDDVWRDIVVPILLLLGLPITHPPKTFSLRLLMIIMAAFSIIIVSVWKSYLTDSLTHEISAFQVSTLKELVQSDLVLGIYSELVDLHCADGTPEADFVCRTADRNLCDGSNDCLDRSAFVGDMATIGTKRLFRYMLPQRYRSATGRNLIYVFKQPLAKDYTVQYYSLGHPLFERSSEFLMWIRTSGFINNLDGNWDHRVQLSYQKYMVSIRMFETQPLQLRQVEGMFVFLLGGLSLGLVAFAYELITLQYKYAIFCTAR